MFQHCIVCNDPSNYKSKTNDAQRIGLALNRLIDRHRDKKKDLKVNNRTELTIKSVIHEPHTMCGHCPKVNENEFRRHEGEIAKAIAIIEALLKSKKLEIIEAKGLKREAFNYCRGFFPGVAQFIERIVIAEAEKDSQ